jgi:hypothetical protein
MDNPRRHVGHDSLLAGDPVRRARGRSQELVAAANNIGVLRSKRFGIRNPSEWTLLVIVAVARRADTNLVTAEFLDSLSHEQTDFMCRTADPIFQVGEFVNIKGDEVSYLYKPTLTPLIFRMGSVVPLPKAGELQLTARDGSTPRVHKPIQKQVRLKRKGGPLSKQELSARLSALGRVIVKDR